MRAFTKKARDMSKQHHVLINRSDPSLAKSDPDRSKSWEPVLDLVSLKAELERRKELSDIRSELERRLRALRSG